MKTAFITGASGDIGREIVRKFIQNGFFVVAQYNKDKESLKKLDRELSASGFSGCLSVVQGDFSNSQGVISCFNDAMKVVKHFDVLINNAGVDLYKLVLETSEEEFDRLFNVNTKSVFLLTKLVLEKMISKKSGKIVNISSVWGKCGACMESVYSASKSAIIGFTKALAKEVGLSGINVNCVCPGAIDTKMNSIFSKEEMQTVVEQTPLSRLGLPKDVAELVYFLSSDASSFITGEVITIDGGWTL